MDTAAWLADQIEAHVPDRESDPSAAARLAEAYAAFAGAPTLAFGRHRRRTTSRLHLRSSSSATPHVRNTLHRIAAVPLLHRAPYWMGGGAGCVKRSPGTART